MKIILVDSRNIPYLVTPTFSTIFFKYVKEKLPNDIKWHKTLFDMAFGSNSKNINILQEEKKEKLEKYLYFRHFIRHSYSSELDWELMGPLVKDIENIWKDIRNDFEIYIKTSHELR